MLRRGMLAASTSGGGGGDLYDEIMADNPYFYLRLADESDAVALNEVGPPHGAYYGNVVLGGAPLYEGGPPSYTSLDAGGRGYFPGSAFPGTLEPALTLGVVVSLVDTTGVHQLLTRDRSALGFGNRFWQWRTNGANMEFVKITGGTASFARPHGMAAGEPAIVHLRITPDGLVSLFVNGSRLGVAQSIPGGNYGSNDLSELAVGNRGAASEARPGDHFSEAFGVFAALSDARILAHAQAGGFA